MFKQKSNQQTVIKFIFLLTGIAGLVALMLLFMSGPLTLPFLTTSPTVFPVPAAQHAAGITTEPRRTRTPEEQAKVEAMLEKYNRLEQLPSKMRISLQDAAWLILTDEQGRRQGYTEAMEYFNEIPVAYKPIERTGLPRRGPPNQEYQFTEDVPVTATILGRDMGTYQYFQTVDRHWFNLEKVPTGKGIKDTIRFDSQGNRFSIHFDPVARDRTGSFAFTDRMNSRRDMENKVTFYGKELPVLTGATLIFTSDIDALLTGKPGMTVALDTDSDGQPERSVVVASGAQNPNGSRAAEFSPQIPEFTELFGTETTSQAKE